MELRNGGLGRAAAIGKAAIGAGERIKLPGLRADRADRKDRRLGASGLRGVLRPRFGCRLSQP
jgi:hypothetical protein